MKHICDIYITNLQLSENNKFVEVQAEGTGGSHKFNFLIDATKAESLHINGHLLLTVKSEA